MKEIEFLLKLQGGAPTVLCSIFEKPVTSVTVYKYKQGVIALAVTPKMRPCTKHISINYHNFWSFVSNCDVKIKHVDTKEKICGYFMKPLDSELFGYICFKLNDW